MLKTAAFQRNDIVRLIALGVLVILEGAVVISTALNLVFAPIGTFYPNVASVAVLVLPVIVGMVARRMEVAIVLAVAPFFVLAVVYTAIYAPVWNIDLYQLGVLAGRIASGGFLLGGLGAFGRLISKIFIRASNKGVGGAI